MRNLKRLEIGFAIVVFAFGIALITYFLQPQNPPAFRFEKQAKAAEVISGIPSAVTMSLIDMATNGCTTIDSTNNLFGTRDPDSTIIFYTYPAASILEFTTLLSKLPGKPAADASSTEWAQFLFKNKVISSPDHFFMFHKRYSVQINSHNE